MRRRRLRPEEAELWARVIEAASPLHPLRPQPRAPQPSPPRPAETAPAAVVPPEGARLVLPPLFGQGQSIAGSSFDPRPPLPERLAAQRGDMDRRKFGKLRRGKLAPEGRIDLHGMTQAEAHAALTGFIRMSQQAGRRLVLVITGKGTGAAMTGVLRRQVPHWLSLPPLRGAVLHLAEAHRSHGGSGALYVYLRRVRDA